MVLLVMQPNFLFAVAIANITLVAVALARFLAVVLVVMDLLCKLGHVFLHGFHARHEQAAFFCPSLGGW